ncbi:PREDICTED: vegetative cell wall protein gp1-like isoform X3 [Camelina sativa]|uniref:Vegetative cell wall protein gp1-like isoform X3 n=1 Tax=Camelina sativa TaxID=90675 RepID=A0ABM0UWS9_CAMSA|nr:PREDICTED: vegetative cell wall protein gp1-like isoform X3 [Camelina sativa]
MGDDLSKNGCVYCWTYEHRTKDCVVLKCLTCNRRGHFARSCPYRSNKSMHDKRVLPKSRSPPPPSRRNRSPPPPHRYRSRSHSPPAARTTHVSKHVSNSNSLTPQQHLDLNPAHPSSMPPPPVRDLRPISSAAHPHPYPQTPQQHLDLNPAHPSSMPPPPVRDLRPISSAAHPHPYPQFPHDQHHPRPISSLPHPPSTSQFPHDQHHPRPISSHPHPPSTSQFPHDQQHPRPISSHPPLPHSSQFPHDHPRPISSYLPLPYPQTPQQQLDLNPAHPSSMPPPSVRDLRPISSAAHPSSMPPPPPPPPVIPPNEIRERLLYKYPLIQQGLQTADRRVEAESCLTLLVSFVQTCCMSPQQLSKELLYSCLESMQVFRQKNLFQEWMEEIWNSAEQKRARQARVVDLQRHMIDLHHQMMVLRDQYNLCEAEIGELIKGQTPLSLDDVLN